MPVVNPTAPVLPPPLPGAAPCNWTIDTTCCSEWETLPIATRDRATAWATQILWALTGRQYGECQVTVRPCGTDCNYYGGWMTYPAIADGVGTVFTPFIRDGSWFNCGCAGACRCEPRCRVWLPGPVAQVTEVLVDGVVIDPSLYRVDNGEWLVGVNGQCWPTCQDLNLEGDVSGVFEVTYTRGRVLPLAGKIAAGELACEFAKACQGQACGLPQNISSLARQGIEVQMINPTDVTDAGLTGIANVDLWIRAVNPGRKTRRPKLYSPDIQYPTMRTS